MVPVWFLLRVAAPGASKMTLKPLAHPTDGMRAVDGRAAPVMLMIIYRKIIISSRVRVGVHIAFDNRFSQSRPSGDERDKRTSRLECWVSRGLAIEPSVQA